MKKIISVFLVITVVCSCLFCSPITSSAADTNETTTYKFLRDVLKVNDASICGIMANIYHESKFNPNAQYTESSGALSYGICQWNKGRLDTLKSFCSKNGYDYTTITGQLYFLKYELEGTEKTAYNKVKNVTDDANGAYTAGYNWAKYFERCATRYYEERGNTAVNKYWPIYGKTQERDTRVSLWMSPNGSGYTAETSPEVTSGTVGVRYYLWYKIFDKITGDYYDSYENDNYEAKLTISYSSGQEVFSHVYNNDCNWISWVPDKADTYIVNLTLSGDLTIDFTRHFTVKPQRATALSIWVSDKGEGYNHTQATKVSKGYVNQKYYVWYKLYDRNTGDLYDTYGNAQYNIKISFLDSNGTVLGIRDFGKNDCGYIDFTSGSAKVYTLKITLSGDISLELSLDFPIEYNAYLTASASSVSLTLNGDNTATISYTPQGAYPGKHGGEGKFTDSKGVVVDSTVAKVIEHYYSNGSYYVTFEGVSEGLTYFTYNLHEIYTDNQEIVASYRIPITVNQKSYIITYNANGGTNAPIQQTKYHGTSIQLRADQPTRSGYTFLGWSTSSTATSATYQPGGAFSIDRDTTLYAVWKKDRELSSVSIVSNPTKTKYYVGDSLSTSGLKLKLIYSDGTTETVDSGFTTSGFSSITAGTKTVTVFYGNKTTTFTVAVQTPSVDLGSNEQTLEIDTILLMNALTDPGDVIVEWSSSNEEVATVLDGYVNPKKSGTTIITACITYKGIKYSASCTVTVVDNILLGDINSDGVIDAGDAVLISRYDAGFITLTAEQLNAGDVNKDGVVDAGDAVIISRYDAGLIDRI